MAVVEDEEALADGRRMETSKIAIALSGQKDSSPIAEFFGKSEAFLIYNVSDERYEIVKNPFSKTFGGSGIQSVQFLIEQCVDQVIVRNIGPNASAVLNSVGVKIHLTVENSAMTVLKEIKIHNKTIDLDN